MVVRSANRQIDNENDNITSRLLIIGIDQRRYFCDTKIWVQIKIVINF